MCVELPPEVESLGLFQVALDAAISIAPGPIFSARHKSHNFVRLNCAYHPYEIIQDALQKLGNLVE